MTDEILKELWDAKDDIAKDHGWDIDNLAEYYLAKQASIHEEAYRKDQPQQVGIT